VVEDHRIIIEHVVPSGLIRLQPERSAPAGPEASAVLGLNTLEVQAALNKAQAHRRRAVHLLAWTRYCCAAALGWIALVSPNLLVETGKSTLTFLKTDPLAKVGALAENIGRLVAGLLRS
jgi:hypothetical protein